MEHFRVDFGGKHAASALWKSFGFFGTGEIGIGASIVVRGNRRRPLWFSGKGELHFDPAQVVNLQRDGQSIHFDVLAGAAIQKPVYIALTAEDEATAERIAQLLPATRTAECDPSNRELRDFMERLARVTPHAVVTPTLVAINVIVFAAMVAGGVGAIDPDGSMVIPWGSNFGPFTTDGQWWRLFTSMFLHFGIVHLALNMWALFDTGRVVERLYGYAQFVLLYVTAGLSGSAASLLWNPMVNSAGASGAIFGVYGGLLAFMLDRRNRVPPSVMNAHRTSTVLFILNSLLYGVTHEGIDNAAHLGGLAGGFVIGPLLVRPLDAETRSVSSVHRLAIALVAGAAALVLVAQPIKNTGETYRKDSQYVVDVEWLREEEKRLSTAWEQWRELADSGSHSPTDLAERLESDVVAPWKAIHDRLTKNIVDKTSRFHTHQVLVLESVTSRQNGFRLIAEGIRTDDPKKMEQAETLFATNDRAIEELGKLVAEK